MATIILNYDEHNSNIKKLLEVIISMGAKKVNDYSCLPEETKAAFEESKYLLREGDGKKYESGKDVIDDLLRECQ